MEKNKKRRRQNVLTSLMFCMVWCCYSLKDSLLCGQKIGLFPVCPQANALQRKGVQPQAIPYPRPIAVRFGKEKRKKYINGKDRENNKAKN
jgi:hypothetical protein